MIMWKALQFNFLLLLFSTFCLLQSHERVLNLYFSGKPFHYLFLFLFLLLLLFVLTVCVYWLNESTIGSSSVSIDVEMSHFLLEPYYWKVVKCYGSSVFVSFEIPKHNFNFVGSALNWVFCCCYLCVVRNTRVVLVEWLTLVELFFVSNHFLP